MKMMKNKTHNDFEYLFFLQSHFQKLLGNEVPSDNPEMMAHHLLGLITEIGEVAQADKRWKKNKRNDHYDRENKIEEIADVAIFLINICLFSNFDADELYDAIESKIRINIDRLKDKEKNDDHNS